MTFHCLPPKKRNSSSQLQMHIRVLCYQELLLIGSDCALDCSATTAIWRHEPKLAFRIALRFRRCGKVLVNSLNPPFKCKSTSTTAYSELFGGANPPHDILKRTAELSSSLGSSSLLVYSRIAWDDGFPSRGDVLKFLRRVSSSRCRGKRNKIWCGWIRELPFVFAATSNCIAEKGV